jgi:hypothetical protein
MRAGFSPAINMAGLGLCVLGASLYPTDKAQASGIPFASNRPQSFQFSSDFTEPYNSVGQEFEYNDDRKRFDDHGNKVAGSNTDTFVGLTSLLHYWKMEGLPNTGFVASITLPEVAIRGNGTRVSGFGDPLVGGLVWYNPTPLRTIGMQAYVQLPTGADSVSSDTYALWPSLFYNEWLGKVNIDLLVARSFAATARTTPSPATRAMPTCVWATTSLIARRTRSRPSSVPITRKPSAPMTATITPSSSLNPTKPRSAPVCCFSSNPACSKYSPRRCGIRCPSTFLKALRDVTPL